ncbi:MAG: hypothetical protein A3B66_03730 [Alphaproteobacteria bacterium RIFCSPHIGHO2_02_FULL_46_13]|nr:MAG: hypothetical protein A3B66_03730 [Alphaproteobacteria bacterium RIFCSPHIGHO2_02_FULL_46_13]
MDQLFPSSLQSSENLPQLMARVWRGRKFVFWGMALGLGVAILLILFLKPQYEATMIVAPPSHDSRTDSFVEGVFVYAPDVEARIPTGSPEFIRFEQSLRGAAVANLIFKMDHIVDRIGEDSLWRGVSNTIKSPQDLALYLSHHIQVETMGATASRKITYRHPDPEFATKLLVMIRKADDQIIRTSVKAETETKIEWLKTEFSKTLNPDHRQALAQLLMSEERRRMLLSLETPYAVNVVEEAASTPRPVVPNRPMILVMLVLVGAACGAVYTLVKDHLSK